MPALAAVFLFLLIAVKPAWAAPLRFEESYVYDASEADSKLTCRAISLIEVKRLLLERLGTYLQTSTEVENFAVTRDEITTITAGIVRTEILNESWDGKTYRLTARIEADPAEVARSIDALRVEEAKEGNGRFARLEESQKESLARIDEMKAQMSGLQQSLINATRDAEKSADEIHAWNAFEKGISLLVEGQSQEALEAFDAAIRVNPGYLQYLHRGKAYLQLAKYSSAVKDFNRALELKPASQEARFLRGKALLKDGQKEEGIREIRKAEDAGFGAARLFLKARGSRPEHRKESRAR